ncbi:MAG TPA: POTRA domain-containing protein [Verrucomicrobiae bacterium]|nr:POTRA domain-containing protein [Verrucomicrobiae bacterium]
MATTQNNPAAVRFNVTTYVVKSKIELPTNVLAAALIKHTGDNVSLDEIVKAAADVQTEYRNQGYPATSIAITKERITNGVVTMNVFQTAMPQIVVSGVRYFTPSNHVKTTTPQSVTEATVPSANPVEPTVILPTHAATLEELAKTQAALHQKMAELDARENDKRIHVVSTNAGPRFVVEKYLVTGNSILSPETVSTAITNIDGAFGTNVSFEGIRTVVEQLQAAYRAHGYVTVAVGLPQQKLTNATVKVQVTEGRLAVINVTDNRYFSSNNVMRALPSLHTNILLNAPILQAELNRANANQDRQIYPVIGPGPYPDTSALTLKVKDQLPLHAKLELNNQSSPGTPDLRLNASAIEDNLWQLNHSLGLQYGFSPENYKQGDQWNFYDKPSVAYYSAFYRLPLGNPEPVESAVANNPNSFGYNEATRQFNLPPASGQTELNVYASRATIDTGVQTILNRNFNAALGSTNISLNQQQVQQGITINEDIGFQLSKPLPPVGDFYSTLSGGLDYKTYSQANYNTNIFIETQSYNINGQNFVNVSTIPTPTPTTVQKLDYLPFEISYNGNLNNFIGPATIGLGLSANLWYSGSTTTNANVEFTGKNSLQNITGSSKSSGHWIILRPSYSQQLIFFNDWVTTFRADGQWASEPLISNEQFGIGGVNSVRGYHEGEIFGDTGWHLSLEQQTPPYVVGTIGGKQPLAVRGSIYLDFAAAYLLDPPEGQPSGTTLWGTGFGFTASVGSSWQARFLFSLPFTSTSTVARNQPYFNFALTAQF